MRAYGVALALTGLLAPPAWAQLARGDDATVPAQLVDALYGVYGQHEGARAVHAKGVVLEGSFSASPGAAALTVAPHLQPQVTVPVTARFSAFSGVPTIADTDEQAGPRGLAVKFRLPDGSASDIVAHSYNGFPSPTAAEFYRYLMAMAASKPGTPKPTPIDNYLGSHPAARAFSHAPRLNPIGYGTITYYGVNSFKMTNARGETAFIRYRFVPVAGERYLSKAEAAKAGRDYLTEELRARLRKEPIKLKLVAQLAERGDKIEDPSIAWPATRRTVELGVLTLIRLSADAAADQALLFLPDAVPAGIAPADPMIEARAAAYPISHYMRSAAPQRK